MVAGYTYRVRCPNDCHDYDAFQSEFKVIPNQSNVIEVSSIWSTAVDSCQDRLHVNSYADEALA